MARVISCETSKNGMLQAVKLRVGKSQMLQGQSIKRYYYWEIKWFNSPTKRAIHIENISARY